MRLHPTGRARPSALSAIAVVGGVLALAGCGGSSGYSSSAPTPASATAAAKSTSTAAVSGEGGGGEALSVAANPQGQLKYDKSALTAKAGKVSIDFSNSAPLGHNLTVASASGAVVAATATFQGGSKTVTATLKPGTYKFYCSVPGHRMAGMEGTLTVR